MSFVCINIYCFGAGKHLDVHFWRLRSYIFRRNLEKTQPIREELEWKGVHFSPELAFLVFIVNLNKVLLPICTLTWRVNSSVSRQGKSINRRNQNTVIFMKIVDHCTKHIGYFLPDSVDCYWFETISSWKREVTFSLYSKIVWKNANT